MTKLRKPWMRALAFIAQFLFYFVLALIIVQNLTTSTTRYETTTFRYVPMISRGESMLPTISSNCINLVEICSLSDLALGDILVYYKESTNIQVCHRVVDLVDTDGDGVVDYATAKGDNNSVVDPIAITDDLVIGKVVWLCNNAGTYITNLVSTKVLNSRVLFMIVCIVIILAAEIAAYIIYRVFCAVLHRTKFLYIFSQVWYNMNITSHCHRKDGIS